MSRSKAATPSRISTRLDDEEAALRRCRAAWGRRWKDRLRAAWRTGDFTGLSTATAATLRALGADPAFGPDGLASYVPPAPPKATFVMGYRFNP